MIGKNKFSKDYEQGTGDEFENFLKGDDDLDEALVGGAGFDEAPNDDEDEMLTSFEE